MPSSKQLRINDPDQIKEKVKDLVGKKINIVLNDNTAMYGELKEVKQLGIVLVNMRLKKIDYPFARISEVYFDSIV